LDLRRTGQRLRLSRTGRAHQQDIALAELDFLFLAIAHAQAFVMIVNGYCQHLFSVLLADHVLIEDRFDFVGRR